MRGVPRVEYMAPGFGSRPPPRAAGCRARDVGGRVWRRRGPRSRLRAEVGLRGGDMTRVRTFGFCAIASVALALAAAGSALASPPEFGRCLKVAKGTGLYATGNCTTTEGVNKNYEWNPGPGPTPGFALTLKPETALTIEDSQHLPQRLNCFGGTGTGEITGPTTI